MLGWRELTLGQRIGGAFLFLLCVVASPLLVFLSATSLAEHVWYAGSACTVLGVILDPQSFRVRRGTPLRFATMPRVCRILVGVGVTLVGLGFIMRHWSTVIA